MAKDTHIVDQSTTQKSIDTVGDLRELLRSCDDQETLDLIFEQPQVMGPDKKIDLQYNGAASGGGGRMIILYFKPKD